MADTRPLVRARVRVEVEIDSEGTWGQAASMAQIVHQAKECLPKLHEAMRSIGGRVVGEPKIISIVASETGL